MDLGMAGGMEQDPILRPVRTTMRPPHEVMALPAGQLGETLVADHAEAVLFLPQAKDLPSSLQMLSHTDAQTSFKVRLPLGIIRIGLAFDFRVPTNRHT